MALTWNAIQKTYSPDPVEYLALAQGLGLQWPLDVFEQLFIDHHDDAQFGAVVALIDGSTIDWSEKRLSGVALRRIGVPHVYQMGADEARTRTAEEAFRTSGKK